MDGGRTGIWVKFRFLKNSFQVTGPGHVTDEEVMRSPGVGGKQVRKPAKAHFSQLLPTHTPSYSGHPRLHQKVHTAANTRLN